MTGSEPADAGRPDGLADWVPTRPESAPSAPSPSTAAAAPPPTQRVPARPVWRPQATYTLLGLLVGVYVLQLVVLRTGQALRYHDHLFPAPSLERFMFVIDTDWPWRPWTLVTSTFAHDPDSVTHLAFNGLFLYFLGPGVERLLGARRFLTLFLLAGAVSGVAQVHLAALLQDPGGALGASGALMAIFGTLMVLLPNQKLMLYFLVPVPLWLAGILYAALDILGALSPHSGIGNFAHLSGLALGLGAGILVRRDWRRRGLRLVTA